MKAPIGSKVRFRELTGILMGYRRENLSSRSVLVKFPHGSFPGHGGGNLAIEDHMGKPVKPIDEDCNDYYYCNLDDIEIIPKANVKIKVKLPSYDRI